jgi:glycosyltransferase involved in cell wall biosynthesis
VKDTEHGFLTESKDPKIFAELVLKLCNDVEFYQKISKTNATMALEFSPERFKQRLKVIYDSL